MAHRFIAGETPAAAVRRLRALADQGVACTVDLLGEATLSEAEADVYARRYAELVETLAREVPGAADEFWQGVPPVNVSLKLSSLCSQFETAAPERVSEVVLARLRPLLRLARQRGAFLNVDMEQHRYKDLVHHAFAHALRDPEFRDFADVGIVVQAYLKDAEDDLRRLRELAEERGTPFSVRLVKGAYWEEERIVAGQNEWPVPVFEEKAATDASFERCTDALLAAWPHLRPAFGTHNPRSVAQAMVKARALGLAGAVEFQTLFGMAEELREAVAQAGFRTRVYAPVGAVVPGMAYLVRRLLENTSNQSWFAQEALAASAEEVLAPPNLSAGAASSSLRRAASPSAAFRNAAPAEFHNPAVRQRMKTALAAARRSFPARSVQPLLIGDEAVGRRSVAERKVGVAEIIVGVSVVRFERDRLPVGIGGLLEGAQRLVGGGEHEPGVGIARVRTAHLLKLRERFCRPVALQQPKRLVLLAAGERVARGHAVNGSSGSGAVKRPTI